MPKLQKLIDIAYNIIVFSGLVVAPWVAFFCANASVDSSMVAMAFQALPVMISLGILHWVSVKEIITSPSIKLISYGITLAVCSIISIPTYIYIADGGVPFFSSISPWMVALAIGIILFGLGMYLVGRAVE